MTPSPGDVLLVTPPRFAATGSRLSGPSDPGGRRRVL